MKKYQILTASIIFIILSCKKEDLSYLHKYPGLPDATQSGLITGGCLVNGKPWVADKEGFWSDRAVYAQYGQLSYKIGEDQRLYIKLEKEVERNQNELLINETLYIDLEPIKTVGLVDTKKLLKFSLDFHSSNYNEKSKSYEFDHRIEPYINITKLDTINKVVSGLFDFRLVRKYFTYIDYSDTIRITNGRFDALYSPG